jgi:short-subunit dehydrogenase
MKNTLVIGGSSGIGKAIVTQCVNANHTVFATYNKHDVEFEGVSCYQLDVTSDSIDLSFLPDQLHHIVFCPGSISLRPFARISPNDFLEDYRLQIGGVVKVLQAALPKLKASGNASVVLFSSVAAGTGLPFHTQVAATKGAIEGLTRALAAELAPTIRVNCIAPSLTDTPLAAALLNTPEKRDANAQRHPLKRIGSADDIASAALFLLSEQSAWITGQVIGVDGGISSLR